MDFEIQDLVIEVTRSCNLNCIHCLRGEPQQKHITKKILDAIFTPKFKACGTLTTGGGEPFINKDAFMRFYESVHDAIKGDFTLGNFYCVSNGTQSIDKDELYALFDLFASCNDKEISGIKISSDGWHDDQLEPDDEFIRAENKKLLSILTCYQDGSCEPATSYDSCVMLEGRAIENKNRFRRTRQPSKNSLMFESLNDQDIFFDTEVYITVHGDVLLGCDWSYKRADNKEVGVWVGNVLQESLYDVLSRVAKNSE